MRYALREVKDDDHPWLVELHNDPVVLHNLTDPRPITLESHLSWWTGINKDAKQQRALFCADDLRIGFAKIYDIDLVNSNCILGGDIHRDFRGRGLAKVMWNLVLERCFNGLSLHRAGLSTASYNEIAQRLYKGLGFREEGRKVESLRRDGVYYDQVCMYITRAMWQEVASRPVIE